LPQTKKEQLLVTQNYLDKAVPMGFEPAI
jgi:hypothetical protein